MQFTKFVSDENFIFACAEMKCPNSDGQMNEYCATYSWQFSSPIMEGLMATVCFVMLIHED
jgi:hypothetical protein